MSNGRNSHESSESHFSSVSEMMREKGKVFLKKAGERVYGPETESKNLVSLIVNGTVLLRDDLGKNGHIPTAGLALPGDIIGQKQGDEHRWTALAVEPTTLCSINKSIFYDHVNDSNALLRSLLANTESQMQRGWEFTSIIQKGDTSQCIASFILWFQNNSQKRPGRENGATEFPFRQEDIGDILGHSRETVQRVMKEMRETGVISYKRAGGETQFQILNMDALRKVAGYVDAPVNPK